VIELVGIGVGQRVLILRVGEACADGEKTGWELKNYYQCS
jgi:hypothetical protein